MKDLLGRLTMPSCGIRGGIIENGHLQDGYLEDPIKSWWPGAHCRVQYEFVGKPECVLWKTEEAVLEAWRNWTQKSKGNDEEWSSPKEEKGKTFFFLFIQSRLQAYWLMPSTSRLSLPLSVCGVCVGHRQAHPNLS